MSTTPTPHDGFFRENVARPVIARDFLHHHLPEARKLRLIERTFGPPSEPIRERITQADSDRLLRWFDRAIDARSLDALLHVRRIEPTAVRLPRVCAGPLAGFPRRGGCARIRRS